MLFGRTTPDMPSRFLEEIPEENSQWIGKPEPRQERHWSDDYNDDGGFGAFGGGYSGYATRSTAAVDGDRAAAKKLAYVAAAAVKNMIANLTGMICDGAKPSCAMKLTSGVSTAVLSAMMAMDGRCVSSVEGIIEEDVDRCIRNLTAIGREGMDETDRLVLRIMTNKC